MTPRKPPRQEKPRSTPPGSRISRRVGRVALLGVVAVLQLAGAAPLDEPFLDARLHVEFDNAWFTTMARNGLRDGALRSQLGVTLARYSAWGKPIGAPTYYTHHPFLMKAIFQQFARLAGTSEAAPRGFALLISFAIAACVLLLVERTTGRLGAAGAAALTFVSIPAFASFETTLKFESDGMLGALLFLLALERALRPGPRRIWPVAATAAVAALSHWTAALAVAIAVALLLARALPRGDRRLRRIALVGAAGLAAGEAALAALMTWLQRGVAPALASLRGGFTTRAETVGFTTGEWAARQWLYLRENLGLPLLVVAAALGGVALVRAWRRSSADRAADDAGGTWLLRAATIATLATAVIWVVLFRQGSFIHVYWQMWLALPIALLVGAAVAWAQDRPRLATPAALAVIVLVAYLQVRDASARERAAADRLGTPDDVAFLSSLREQPFERLVFLALSRAPFNDWFDGPLFAYYTDRSVEVAGPSERLRASDEVIVVRQSDQRRAVEDLGRRLGVRLTDERCSSRLCAYGVRPL